MVKLAEQQITIYMMHFKRLIFVAMTANPVKILFDNLVAHSGVIHRST